MLITHHPIIFKAIKDITEQNILGKIRDLIKMILMFMLYIQI